eukprot:sb/3463653/
MAPYQLYASIRSLTRGVMHTAETRAEYIHVLRSRLCTEYDKNVRGPYFNEGDTCFILVNCPKHKYADKWIGPFVIHRKINDHNYVIKINGEEKVVNISKMKLYKSNKYSPPTTTNLQDTDIETTPMEVESYPIHFEEKQQPSSTKSQPDTNPMDSIPISDNSDNESDDDRGGGSGSAVIQIPNEPETPPPNPPPNPSPMETGQVEDSSSPMETGIVDNAGSGLPESSPMETGQVDDSSSPMDTGVADNAGSGSPDSSPMETSHDPSASEPPPMETGTADEPTPGNEKSHNETRSSGLDDISFRSAVSDQEDNPTSPPATDPTSVLSEEDLNSSMKNDDTFTESQEPENQPMVVSSSTDETKKDLSRDEQSMAAASCLSDRLISLPEIDQHRTPTGGTVSTPSKRITRASGEEDLSNLGQPGSSRSPYKLRPRPTKSTSLFQSLPTLKSKAKGVMKSSKKNSGTNSGLMENKKKDKEKTRSPELIDDQISPSPPLQPLKCKKGGYVIHVLSLPSRPVTPSRRSGRRGQNEPLGQFEPCAARLSPS